MHSRGWSRASILAIVVAIAVACGFLNPAASAAPAVSLSLSIAPVALAVRAAGVTVEIRV